jgi:hypothetical protein
MRYPTIQNAVDPAKRQPSGFLAIPESLQSSTTSLHIDTNHACMIVDSSLLIWWLMHQLSRMVSETGIESRSVLVDIVARGKASCSVL